MILLHENDSGSGLPTDEQVAALVENFGLDATGVRIPEELVGSDGRTASLYSLPESLDAPDGYRFVGLRQAHALLAEDLFRDAGTARQKIDWVLTHRFCGRCAGPTERSDTHEAMACTECGHLHFPRLSPAVIVLVQRDREALLGRSPHFTDGVYSTLAGFVEPGESLEECVHREIEEEVSVQVGNLRYFGSQPHPFPHSLMVGFIADWVSGDIQLDPAEMEDARWFTPEALPSLPHPMSIARALIEDFVQRVGAP